jgi:hypothetical protein
MKTHLTPRTVRFLVIASALLLLGWAGGRHWWAGAPAAAAAPGDGQRWLARFRVAIPQQTYTAIVVSPRPAAQLASALFLIRTIDALGNVEDFAFHVKPGETLTLPFGESAQGGGWAPNGESILYAIDDLPFAAWGIAREGLVRFEPVERDPGEGIDERERQRDLERFRRERDRTK